MATSTTNLGLTKPAGTDKIRIAQINGNMDILDEKIGAVGNTSLQAQVTSQNQAISDIKNAYNLGEGTKSEMESALTTLGNGMANNEVRNIKFGITTASDPLAATTYLGTIVRNSSGRYIVNVTGISATGQIITGNYRNSAWGWDALALKSNISRNATVSTNFNDYTVTTGSPDGHYYGADISSFTNKPANEVAASPFSLDVRNNGGYVQQILYVYQAEGIPRIYARQQKWQSGGARPFGDWTRIQFVDEPMSNWRVYLDNAGTNTLALPKNGLYLLSVQRTNTSDSNYQGLYIAQLYDTAASSCIKTISASSVATLSISDIRTISITTTSKYVTLCALKLQ